MAQDWFYVQNGQQQGPLSFEAIQAIGREGRLQPDTLIWTQTMSEWQPASSVPGLLPAPAYAPAPPIGSRPPALPPQFPGGYHAPASVQHLGYAQPMQNQPDSPLGENAGMRWVLPVGRSGWAIAAGYMGLLSVLVVFSPLAILFSILAFREMKKHPNRHGMGRAIFGMAMGIIFLVVGVLLLATRWQRF